MAPVYRSMCGCNKASCYYDGVALAHDAGFNLAYDQPAATVPAKLTEHSQKMQARIYSVAERVFCAVGYAGANVIFVVGDDGIIICDVTESTAAAAQTWQDFKRCAPQFAHLPIKAVIYTHNHLDHVAGVRAFVNDDDVASGRVPIIAHESLMAITINNTGLVGPALGARAAYSFGSFLETGPEGRVNVGLGPALHRGPVSFIAPSITFKDALEMTIAGIRFEFRYAPSEADDEIVIWLPDLKVMLSAEVVQGECFANVHTIRGTLYRDPVKWVRTLDMMRRYAPEAMVPAHGRPVSGAAQVEDLLRSYRDAIAFTHDQTIRLINLGATPDEIAEQVPGLPAHLRDHPWLGEYYGTVKHSARQVFNGQMGWFEGDPTFLDPLPRVERSQRTIALMGGRDAVVKAAQTAFVGADTADKNDGARWAAELLTFVLRVAPEDHEARSLKAAALRHLGFATVNTNWRNWYISSARELEGTLDVGSANAGGAFAHPDFIRYTPVLSVLERFSVRVNPALCADRHVTLGFHFTDAALKYAVEVRRGVVQVHQSIPAHADAVIALTTPVFWKLMRKMTTEFPKALQAGEVVMELGEVARLGEFFACFDPPPTGMPKLTLR